MLRVLRARSAHQALILGSLAAALCLTAVAPNAARAQTPDPFGSGVGGAFGGSYVAAPTSGDLLPSYNFTPTDTAMGSSDVPALTGGRPVITYTLGGAYCTLPSGEQLWVPSGASPDAMGCGRAAVAAPSSNPAVPDAGSGE